MTVKNHHLFVKDNFRHVTFTNNDEVTLCTDCLRALQTSVLIAIIASEYEEVQCEMCSCMNSVLAYEEEIQIGVILEKQLHLRRRVERNR